MSTVPVTSRGAAAAVDRSDWITPQEQLDRLYSGFSEQRTIQAIVAGTAESPGAVPVVDIAGMIAQYVLDRIPSALTNWHTALERLGMLPERLPPLPANIGAILASPCPIHTEVAPDGSLRKVRETHSLYLIPAGSVNDLAARVSAYGEMNLAAGVTEHPFKFRCFWRKAREEHGDTQSDEPQWILTSNDVLPGSRNQPYKQQVEIVRELGVRAQADYGVPCLRQAVAFAFLHLVATRERVWQSGSEENRHVWTHTRVQETTDKYGFHFVVGGFAPGGLLVFVGSFADVSLGVAVLRKF